jgi:hypothetical protein
MEVAFQGLIGKPVAFKRLINKPPITTNLEIETLVQGIQLALDMGLHFK